MAELLVRVVSKANASDPYKDVKLTKRGDVIAVVPDGWQWSDAEMINPAWRIFKWPSVSVVECEPLLAQEEDTREVKIGADPMLQRRGHHLNVDLTSLPNALKNYLSDETRAAPWFNVPAQVTMAAIMVKKPKLHDPNVIGKVGHGHNH